MGPKLSPDYSWKFVNLPDSAVDGNLLVTTDSKRPSISNYYYYQRIEGSGEGGGTFCSETLRLTDTRFVYLFFHFIPGFVPTTIEPKNNNVLCGFLITVLGMHQILIFAGHQMSCESLVLITHLQ